MERRTIDFVDIVSKPVGVSYDTVQTLGIYCWQYENQEKRAAYFMPRFSYEQNKEYLAALYPNLKNDVQLQGKGIYTSIWKIAKAYNSVSLENATKVLYDDIPTLSAFIAWCNIFEEPFKIEKNTLMQVYVLDEEKRFAEYKYTEKQNTPATIYYDWQEILNKREIEQKEK